MFPVPAASINPILRLPSQLFCLFGLVSLLCAGGIQTSNTTNYRSSSGRLIRILSSLMGPRQRFALYLLQGLYAWVILVGISLAGLKCPLPHL